jgi:Flp pilus assembly protein protease CpaA
LAVDAVEDMFRLPDLTHVIIIAVYSVILVVCAASDLATFRVPNVITYPSVLLALLIGALLPDSDLGSAVIGGAAAGIVMLLALIMSRGGMGLGDVKLSVFVGVALGWPFIAPAMILTAVAGVSSHSPALFR